MRACCDADLILCLSDDAQHDSPIDCSLVVLRERTCEELSQLSIIPNPLTVCQGNIHCICGVGLCLPASGRSHVNVVSNTNKKDSLLGDHGMRDLLLWLALSCNAW